MITRAFSASYIGIHAYEVEVEVDVTNGLPQFQVVGLPDVSVKESKERVRSAIKNTGYPFPMEKITVNLAPADIKKEGPAFDLPIALGILAANEIIHPDKLRNYTFLGELALDGTLRPFKGSLVIAGNLSRKRTFIFPEQNAKEAALEKNVTVYGVKSLKEVVNFLQGETVLEPQTSPYAASSEFQQASDVDFSEIRGQEAVKRALEIAISGGHNILLIGPPGSGDSVSIG